MSKIPVKTNLLQVIEGLLEGVAGINSVHRWEDIPFDLDLLEEAALPACFFWEQEERLVLNRLNHNVLTISLGVFVKLQGGVGQPSQVYQLFSEQADEIAASLHNQFVSGAADLQAAGVLMVQEGRVSKALANETWGELDVVYDITYAHAVGNAFSF